MVNFVSSTHCQEQLNTYLISDLHLEASRPATTKAFTKFLAKISPNAEALYILGDLVESWIGDDDDSHFNKHLKAVLANFVKSVAPVYFIHGNRDFLIGGGFCEATGVKILAEYTCVDLYGTHVLLLHGDSLCTGDTAYQKFRNKVRDPVWQKKMLRYPLWIRKWIASYLRFRSRKANSTKANDIMDVAETEVISTFRHHNVQTIIHGHTHRPDTHQYTIAGEAHKRIVLGDWGAKVWYIQANTRQLELLSYPA